MRRILYGTTRPKDGFLGWIAYKPYQAYINGRNAAYWDEPEADIPGHWDRYQTWLEENRNSLRCVTLTAHYRRRDPSAWDDNHTWLGYASYPFKKSWWYNPIEWLIKFPWRVWRFSRNAPRSSKLFGTIQVFGGLNDWIYPRNWMVRYQEWMWKKILGDRLDFIGWFIWDVSYFDGLRNHPETLEVLK